MNNMTARPKYASYLPPALEAVDNSVLKSFVELYETLLAVFAGKPREVALDSCGTAAHQSQPRRVQIHARGQRKLPKSLISGFPIQS